MKPQFHALALAAFFVLTQTGGSAQSSAGAQNAQAAKEQILELDQQLNAAAVKGDLNFFAQVMSDDYVGVAPDGTILRKGLIAAHYLAGTLHYEAVAGSDTEVHFHNDCAILTEVTDVKGHDGATDLSGTYRITRVFLKRNGNWQVVAFQATPMRPALAK